MWASPPSCGLVRSGETPLAIGRSQDGTEDVIYVGGTEFHFSGLCAFRPNGDLKWTTQKNNPDQRAPGPLNLTKGPSIGPDGTLYSTAYLYDQAAGSGSTHFVALDPASGLAKWSVAFPDSGLDTGDVLVAANHRAYFSNGGRLWTVDLVNHAISFIERSPDSPFTGGSLSLSSTGILYAASGSAFSLFTVPYTVETFYAGAGLAARP